MNDSSPSNSAMVSELTGGFPYGIRSLAIGEVSLEDLQESPITLCSMSGVSRLGHFKTCRFQFLNQHGSPQVLKRPSPESLFYALRDEEAMRSFLLGKEDGAWHPNSLPPAVSPPGLMRFRG